MKMLKFILKLFIFLLVFSSLIVSAGDWQNNWERPQQNTITCPGNTYCHTYTVDGGTTYLKFNVNGTFVYEVSD